MNAEATDQGKDVSYLKTLSVLYVEDEEDIRNQLAQFLNRRCAAVYTAQDGEQGLRSFMSYQPDIIVSDILMPVMDGLKMGAAIRDQNPAIPLIITTAFEEPDYFRKAIDLGVNRYVTKPVAPEQLLDALLKCARSVRAAAAVRAVEERYGLMFRMSQTAIAIFDVPARLTADTEDAALGDWRLLECNPAFLKLLDAPSTEAVVHERWTDLIAPEYRAALYQTIRNEWEAHDFTSEFEVELLRGTGGRIPAVVQLLLRRNRAGTPMEGLAVIHGRGRREA